jgi:undecaprenyl-diphosphatase
MQANQLSMSIQEAVVLGVVQGLTEFLPISSTAHLRVVPTLMGWGDPGAAFSAVIQLGSVVAVLGYFAKDLLQIVSGFFAALGANDFSSREFRLGTSIILGSVPICVLGLALKNVLEADASPLRSLEVIGFASLFMGVLLWLAERFGKRERTIDEVSIKDGILIGLGQALALVPGCSRSGSTLTVSLFLGMKREDAARFSFLLGIPAIVLSGLVELDHLVEHKLTMDSAISLGAGLITSAIVSYVAIWWMINYLKTHSTKIFILYRLVFGAAILALAYTGMYK